MSASRLIYRYVQVFYKIYQPPDNASARVLVAILKLDTHHSHVVHVMPKHQRLKQKNDDDEFQNERHD
jgi:hypothetical protein